MIYPKDFEHKIGFKEIRDILKTLCLSVLGKEQIDLISFSTDHDFILSRLDEIKEFKRIEEQEGEFPLQYFYDMRPLLARLRIEKTYPEEHELMHLQRSLKAIIDVVAFLSRTESCDATSEKATFLYPTLHQLTLNINVFPHVLKRIGEMLDKFGKIRDNASPTLYNIRTELSKIEGSVSRILNGILRSIQQEGLIEKDVTPTLRDGRLVIPTPPGVKRKIRGIVHDESATGKTVFIEPAEVVEANNRIRELENEERREIIRLLTEFANTIRPELDEMKDSYWLLAQVDAIRAKSRLAKQFHAIEPVVKSQAHVDWVQAVHPLLQRSLTKQGKKVVPLDLTLSSEQHLLIISGPNAGGKSVCLKTAGLLQYMLQCGLSVPMAENSTMGIFESIMIDIGDEQSIENDLSTYSSHLLNMKMMMRHCNPKTLLLIDEFGSGTEPQIGGAMAQAMLHQFYNKKAFGVITTHYQNLKHFADSHKGVVNGAMLYDRKEMQALFQLSIGQPGSSFAIEIARKTGIPESVIQEASELVGSDYIQSDKYLQDIVRDKRYWENKRQTVHKREKDIEQVIQKYEKEIAELNQSRKDILKKAKEQAEELLKESNKKIENTIREIKLKQAEKEATRQLRNELNIFKEQVQDIDKQAEDEKIARKIEQIKQRKERHEKHKKEKGERENKAAAALRAIQKPVVTEKKQLIVGDTVRIKGLSSVGTIEQIVGNNATVVVGDVRTKVNLNKLEAAKEIAKTTKTVYNISKETRQAIESRKQNFRQDLDVRGLRGDEALIKVMHFIDDATLVGMPRVRILHGTGNGILRTLIRQYLNTIPAISSFKDEHVQFGGAGITVVDFD